MAVTLFTGRPGSGKSYRVVHRMLEECNKYFIFHNVDGLKVSELLMVLLVLVFLLLVLLAILLTIY